MKLLICAALSLTVSSACIPDTASAAPGKEKETATLSENQVTVNYVSYADNAVVFRVSVDNPAAVSFRLVIKNDAGDILFNGSYSDIRFDKAIHLIKEEDEISPVFIIRSGKQQIERSFKVSTAASGTEKVIVTRL